MKITYINKDSISEGFIKTVDKMKGSLDKKYTADDIRKEAKKILVEEILENKEFLYDCRTCFNSIVHPTLDAISPSEITFRHVNVTGETLNVICDAYYKIVRRIYHDEFWIDDTILNKYSVEEINNMIDNYCTKRMLQYFKKNQPELLEQFERIHIERINLWNDTLENINNGDFPENIPVKMSSEFYSGKIFDETELNELLDKFNSLFSFRAKTIVVKIRCAKVKEHKDELASDVAALLDGNNYTNQQMSTSPDWVDPAFAIDFDTLSLAGLTRKDLHKFTIKVYDKVIDLYKYLTNNDIEKSTVEETLYADAMINRDTNIITTASYSEIEQIKCYLPRFISSTFGNSSYRETSGRYLPEPKSGAIKYFLTTYNYNNTRRLDEPFIKSIDYIDGNYHKAYYTLLRK